MLRTLNCIGVQLEITRRVGMGCGCDSVWMNRESRLQIEGFWLSRVRISAFGKTHVRISMLLLFRAVKLEFIVLSLIGIRYYLSYSLIINNGHTVCNIICHRLFLSVPISYNIMFCNVCVERAVILSDNTNIIRNYLFMYKSMFK